MQGVTSSSGKYTARLGCTTLAPAHSCLVAVSYSPTRLGTKAASITVKSTAPNSPLLVSVTAQ